MRFSAAGFERDVASVAAVLATLTLLSAPAPTLAQEADQKVLQPSEAIEHVGEFAAVCGEVVSAPFAAGSNGRPTFLNLDKPYPNHVFTAVIWGEDRSKFEAAPEDAFDGEQVCVSGRIETYRGDAQIEVSRPGQIEVQGEVEGERDDANR